MIELLWIKSLFHFLIVLECIFFILILNKKYTRVSTVLNSFLSVLALIQIIGFLHYTIWIRNYFPLSEYLFRFTSSLQLLLGPILLFFVSDISNRNSDKTLLHYIPAVFLFSLTILDFNFISSFTDDIFIFTQLHIILYGFFSVLILKNNGFESKAIYNFTSQFLIIIIASKSLRFIEFFSWQTLDLISEITAWVLFIFAEVIMTFGIAQFLFRFLITPNLLSSKVKNGQIPDSILGQLQSQLNNFLSQPEVYADPLINVQKIADHFKVAPHHISKYLNHYQEQSFVEIINEYRIKACIELLKDQAQKEKSIKDIYYQTGFNSKSVFYTAFKKQTGLTPGEFRLKHKASHSKST